MRKKLRAGILAATGTVGQRFIELFAYQPNSEITALAASASAGKTYREACAWQLSSDPPPHVADMEMDRSSHYRALDPMERDEWVKIRAGTNALSRTAVITSIRVPVLAKGGKQWEQVQTRVVERFGQREWSAFVAQVDRLRECASASKEEPLRFVSRSRTRFARVVKPIPRRRPHGHNSK